MRQDLSSVLFDAEYTNPFGITKYRDIGIVRSEQELSGQFGLSQFRTQCVQQ